MTVERPPIPTDERKPAWRRACLAYREWRQAGASEQEAHEAAVAAVKSMLPLVWKEASAEAVNTFAFATPVARTTDQEGIHRLGLALC